MKLINLAVRAGRGSGSHGRVCSRITCGELTTWAYSADLGKEANVTRKDWTTD